jgi:dTDP-4-dehydrorhamnose reductase
MLGAELSRLFRRQGIAFTGTDREVDITERSVLEAFVQRHNAENNRPIEWIINCAAYTAVDKAEDDCEVCRRLNTDGAANAAAAARNAGARFIQLSTDYVFDGNGIKSTGNGEVLHPYREDDETNPVGMYGLTKRDGEKAVLETNPESYIIRTAWLYGQYGGNFVHTMLRLMNERDSVSVVDDQRGSPTWTADLAEALLGIITAVQEGRQIPYGVYHYSNEGVITWFDLACEIYDQGRRLGLIQKDCAVKPCSSAEYPARVKRPAYSALDKTKFKTTLGMDIPPWDKSLITFLEQKTFDAHS